MISLLVAAALLAFQDGPEPALQEPAGPEMVWDEMLSSVQGDEVVYEWKNLALVLPDGHLNTMRATLRLDRERYRAAVQSQAGEEERQRPVPPAAEMPQQPTLSQRLTMRLIERLGLPPGDRELARGVLLHGKVDIESAGLVVKCASLDHDARTGTTLLRMVDLRFPPGQGPRGWPVRIITDELRERADGSLYGEDLSLTTCDKEDPHYALRLASITGRPKGAKDWSWSPSGGALAIEGLSVLPLPTPDFETGESFLAIQSASIGQERSRGFNVEVELSASHELAEGTTLDWSFRPGWWERRGFPLSAAFDLKSDDYELDWDLFVLKDNGRDVHPFTSQVIRPGDLRWRAYLHNRFFLGDGWRLDADVEAQSDPLVSPEFFSPEWYAQEDARSLLRLQYAGDDSYFSVEGSYRIDEAGFTPITGFGPAGGPVIQTVDSLPVARWDQFATTLLDLPAGPFGGADGVAPLNVSLGGEVGYFRLRDRELTAPSGRPAYTSNPIQDRLRGRAWGEAAAPLHLGGLFFRPGMRAEGAVYDKSLVSSSGVERGTVEAFVETGAMFVKRWDHGWEHHVLPQVRWRYRRVDGTPQALIPLIDRFDRLSAGQAFELSLRQFYFGPESDQPWMDFDVLIPFYPQEKLPLSDPIFPSPRAGDPPVNWGPAEFRMVWTPGVYGETLEGVRMESKLRHNIDAGGFEELYTRVSLEPHERLKYSFGWRKVEDLFSIADFAIDWRLSDDWGVHFVQPYSFTGGGVRASRLALSHYAHDFVFEVGFRRDVAAGSSGVFFNLMPRFLVDSPPRGFSD